MIAMSRPELTIVRTFDAPAALVFSMWTDPRHFAMWIGPEGFTCPSVAIDFRVGGAYRALIVSDDAEDNWFGGQFREIVPYSRLALTFAWDNTGPSAGVETLVTLTFEERDGQTVQTFHQAPFLDEARRDSHCGGWTSSFEKLAHQVRALAVKAEISACDSMEHRPQD
jgi:uncharacterized protein YndB with AHSA1/START domain